MGQPAPTRTPAGTTVEDFLRARYLYSLTRGGEAAERALATFDDALGRRTVDIAEADEDAFIAYKDRLVDYLQRFVRDLVVLSAEIAQRLLTLDPAPLLDAAARHEAADAVPGEDGVETVVAARRAEWEARWAGLSAWFVGDRGHPSQSALLRDRARAAVPALLDAARTVHERRAGRTDRSADFRTPARWFAEADDDGDCHRLWRAAFGLAPARHLTVDGDTLDARRAEPVPPSTSWADAPPIVVRPRLRRTGSAERRGRPTSVADRTAGRRRLAELQQAERAQTEAARRRFATEHRTRGRRTVGEPGGVAAITELAVDRLVSLRLARLDRRDDGGTLVTPLPALARFRQGALHDDPQEVLA